jgi:hypothetical protein
MKSNDISEIGMNNPTRGEWMELCSTIWQSGGNLTLIQQHRYNQIVDWLLMGKPDLETINTAPKNMHPDTRLVPMSEAVYPQKKK